MRIAELQIENFRGIPGRLSLDLRSREGARPASLLLLGDNGSGKSSILDALEFVLRASLWRRIDPEKPVKRHAQNLAVSERPYVEVALDDGSRYARGGPARGRFAEGVAMVGDKAIEAFSLAPIVLRRADVLGFWHLEPERRKLVFIDYFTPSGLGVRSLAKAREDVAAARSRLERHRAHVETSLDQLAERVGVGRDHIPRDLPRLKTFRRDVLLKDFATNRRGQFGEVLVRQDVNRPYRQLVGAVKQLQATERTLSECEGRLEEGTGSVGAELEEVFAEANRGLGPAFLEITGLRGFISDIQLETEAGGTALDVHIVLANGEEASPEDVLSEASLDLLALLIYVSVVEATASHGQARVLALDDVFQSVDAVYRSRATHHIVREFKDWQLFITTHDRLWFEVLADAFKTVGAPRIEREIARWSFEGGPVLFEAQLHPAASLRHAQEGNDPASICSAAGLLLEQICDRLSWTLPAAVPRRRGDRYDLGALWDAVKSKLKKSNIREELDDIAESKILRNLVGAHFNQWARSVSQQEAQTFALAVEALLTSVYCEECGRWIEPAERGVWRCPGRHIAVFEKKAADEQRSPSPSGAGCSGSAGAHGRSS